MSTQDKLREALRAVETALVAYRVGMPEYGDADVRELLQSAAESVKAALVAAQQAEPDADTWRFLVGADAATTAHLQAGQYLAPAAQQAEPVAPKTEQAGRWEGAEEWEPLAWALCADEHGEEACTELLWDGGAVPEPWGDRWLKYEGEAKRLIAMVREHVPAAREERQAVALTEEQIRADERARLVSMQTDGLAELIRADERERCARIADDAWVRDPHVSAGIAIRAANNLREPQR